MEGLTLHGHSADFSICSEVLVKDVPTYCEPQSPTKAEVIASEKAPIARTFSVPDILLVLGVAGAVGYFALQPQPPTFAPPASATDRLSAERDEVRPKW